MWSPMHWSWSSVPSFQSTKSLQTELANRLVYSFASTYTHSTQKKLERKSENGKFRWNSFSYVYVQCLCVPLPNQLERTHKSYYTDTDTAVEVCKMLETHVIAKDLISSVCAWIYVCFRGSPIQKHSLHLCTRIKRLILNAFWPNFKNVEWKFFLSLLFFFQRFFIFLFLCYIVVDELKLILK